MHLLFTTLLFWIGITAASLVAAVLVVAVEISATHPEQPVSADAPGERRLSAAATGLSAANEKDSGEPEESRTKGTTS